MTGLHSLVRNTERRSMRVGRGGKRGKTAGRGTKGQNARAGRKKRPEMRDIIKKLPKRRGYGKNRGRTVDGTRPAPFAISLERLEMLFENGAEITPKVLVEKGIVKGRGAKMPAIKVVSSSTKRGNAGSEMTKKFSLKGVGISSSARAILEHVGGSIS